GGAPVRVRAKPLRQDDGVELLAHAGEIIGLAGLSGHGQSELILDVFAAASRRSPRIEVTAKTSFVAGDRQSDCIFPLWSIAENIGIGSVTKLRQRFLLSAEREVELAESWRDKIGIRAPDLRGNILTLSGGNQQKALFARALASDAGIVLMDDPMRGVDF